jgi:PAS domain S-box-containing protein
MTSVGENRTRERPVAGLRHPVVGASVIAVIGFALAIAVGIWVGERNDEVTQGKFNALTRRVVVQIKERLAKYEYATRGARGVIVVTNSTGISQQGFRDYGKTRDIRIEFPGLRGFGFIERVAPGSEAAFVARRRADGFPDFKIRQMAPHSGERWIIRYIEPLAPNRVAVGLDVASEKVRRDAATIAMLTGKATLSAPIKLVQTQAGGFSLFLPVYRPGKPIATSVQRARAAIGWTFATLGIVDILAPFNSSELEYDVSITDTSFTGTEPFFQTVADAVAADRQWKRDVRITPFGRTWQVRVTARPAFTSNLSLPSPVNAAIITFLLSLIPAGLAWIVLAGNQRRFTAGIRRARLAAIVSGSNDAIIGRTLDGTVTEWNAAAERLFGIGAHQAIGQRIADLIVPEHLQSEEAETLARLRDGKPTPLLKTQRLRSDGTTLPVQISISPIRAPDGNVIGAATTVRDVSDQQAAEVAIRELNATLETQVAERTAQLRASSVLQNAILNYAGYAVIATDTDGVITLFNPAAEKMLGYAAVEVVGHYTPVLFHEPHEVADRAAAMSLTFGETIEPGFEVFVHHTKRGLPNIANWTYVTKAGERLPIRLNTSPIRTGAGEALGFLGIAVDLTEQQRREAELQAARLAAEQAAAAKAEFLATMSHELRTPLNSVIGFSRLMLESGELTTPGVQRQARLVHESSKMLLTVINDVLDVSKMDSGRFELDPRPFSLRHLIVGTIDLLRGEVLNKNLTIEAELPPDLPALLMGDDGRLRQILINLLSNAIKFTARGGVRLIVDHGAVVDNMIPLKICVTDSGIGIPQSKHHRIFARFSQADGSTAREYGGSGLGLSISRSLIEIMGGTIGFDSEEGRGSTFWIALELPLATDQTLLSQPRMADLPITGRPLRILLAEDIEMNQELAIAYIGRWGHTVDVAANGAAAVAAVQRGGYDLVLMDVQMPVMDGVEATERIRAGTGPAATIPIIAMTANALPNDIARFRAAGMNDHVGKPFDPAQLHAVIDRWQPEQSRAEPTDETPASAAPAAPAPALTLQQKYQARRQAFAESLVASRSALGTVKSGESRAEIKMIAHQLSGIAGMFGEERLGDLAAAVEASMGEVIASPGDAEALRLAQGDLDALLAKLDIGAPTR